MIASGEGVFQRDLGWARIISTVTAEAEITYHIEDPSDLYAMVLTYLGASLVEPEKEVVNGETLVQQVRMGVGREGDFGIAHLLACQLCSKGIRNQGKVVGRT
jgi:hypothetical protein